MTNTKVSIIIVNWNAKQYLHDCISSLENQSYGDFEIILVDNASSDGSVEFIEKNFPKVQVIKNKDNLGFAEGNNIGIKNSKGDLIALFNPDAVADKEWLGTLVSILKGSDRIGGVAGKLFYYGDKFGKNAVFCTWSKIDHRTAKPYNFHDGEPMSHVDYLTGAAMLVKREVVEKIGLLDPNYFLFFEETDWCARMIRADYDLIYVPTAIAWHVVSGSVSNSDLKSFYMDRNRIRFAIKNFDSSYLPLFWGSILKETIQFFVEGIVKKDFTSLKTRLRSLAWNLIHLTETTRWRKEDFNKLRQNSQIKSYNRSLPLREIKNTYGN